MPPSTRRIAHFLPRASPGAALSSPWLLALALPVPLEAPATPNLPSEAEAFELQCRLREIAVSLAREEREQLAEAASSVNGEGGDSSNALSDLLQVLVSQCPATEHTRVFHLISRLPDPLPSAFLDFFSDALSDPGLDSQAALLLQRLVHSANVLDAFRLVPYLSTHPEFMPSLANVSLVAANSSNSFASHDELIDVDSPVAHWPLSGRVNSLVDSVEPLHVIGSPLFANQPSGLADHGSVFLPPLSSLVAAHQVAFNVAPLSVEIWVSTATGGVVYSSLTADEPPRGYRLVAVPGAGVDTSFQLWFGSQSLHSASYSSVFTHVAFTLDESGLCILYINGAEDCRAQLSLDASWVNTDAPFCIGANRFAGHVHNLAVFNRVLPSATVAVHANRAWPSALSQRQQQQPQKLQESPGTSSLDPKPSALQRLALWAGMVAEPCVVPYSTRTLENVKEALALLRDSPVALLSLLLAVERSLEKCDDAGPLCDALVALMLDNAEVASGVRRLFSRRLKTLVASAKLSRFAQSLVGNAENADLLEACVHLAVESGQPTLLADLLATAANDSRLVGCILSSWLAVSRDVGPPSLSMLNSLALTSRGMDSRTTWSLCALVCRTLPAPLNVPGNALNDFFTLKDPEAAEAPLDLDSVLQQRILKEVSAAQPIPRLQVMRFANKPGEAQVRAAHVSLFFALLKHSSNTQPGFARMAWRASFTLFPLLSAEHQQTGADYGVLAQRILDSCRLLHSRAGLDLTAVDWQSACSDSPAEISVPSDPLVKLAANISDPAATERALQGFQSRCEDMCARMEIIAHLLPIVSVDQRSLLVIRGLLAMAREPLTGCGPSLRARFSQALGRAVDVAMANGMESVALHCLLHLGPGAEPSVVVRAVNACASRRDEAPIARKLPKVQGQQWEASSEAAGLVLGTHGLVSGVFYFELSSSSQECALVSIGLATRGERAMAVGAKAVVGSLAGTLGVLIDLDANVVSLHVAPAPMSHSQSLAMLGNRLFSLKTPSSRPLYPALRVLSQGVRISTVFCESAAEQIRNLEPLPNGSVRRPAAALGPLAASPPAGTDAFDACPALFACGQNALAELGTGDVKHRRRPAECSSVPKDLFPVQVVCGNEFTALLTASGQVYAWGMNDNGSCGQGLSPTHAPPGHVPLPSIVPTLQRKIICSLFCNSGSEHVLATTPDGETLAWGLNRFGQLGLGHTLPIVHTPTLISALSEDADFVVSAATSYSHTLVVTKRGVVKSFGLNSKGQLGVGTQGEIRPLPQLVAGGLIAKSVAAGAVHSVVVTTGGRVYSFGRNDCGQLGDASVQDCCTEPMLVSGGALKNFKAKAVACGYYFSLVLGEDGTLCAFGKNDTGQLGQGHARVSALPETVPIDGSVQFITCGTGHWLAMTCDGRVFSCGRNKFGAVGDGSSADRLAPVAVDLSSPALSVAAGFHHSCFLLGSAAPPVDDNRDPLPLAVLDRLTRVYPNEAWPAVASRLSSNAQDLDFLASLAALPQTHPLLLAPAWSSIDSVGAGHQKLKVRTDEVAVLQASLSLVRVVLKTFPDSFVSDDRLNRLLQLAALRKDLGLASEAVSIIRVLMGSTSQSARVLNEVLRLLTSLQPLGAVCVLGGNLPVVRNGALARVLVGEQLGVVGRVAWFRPLSRVVAKVVFEAGPPAFCRRVHELVPVDDVDVPYDVLPDGALSLLSQLALKSAADAHLRLCACKAMAALLACRGDLVKGFFEAGHLELLAGHLEKSAQDRLGSADRLHALESRYAQVLALHEILGEQQGAPDLAPAERDEAEAATSRTLANTERWDLCTLGTVTSARLGDDEVDVLQVKGEGIPLPCEVADEWSLVLDARIDSVVGERGEALPGWPVTSCDGQWHRYVLVKLSKSAAAYLDGSPVRLGVRPAGDWLLRGVRAVAKSLQLRRYGISSDEARLLGGPAVVIPAPSEHDLAARLCEETGLPRRWCARALQLNRSDFASARSLLQLRQGTLVRRGRALAQALTGLGFDAPSCALAVSATADPVEAVAFLLDEDGSSLSLLADPSSARAVARISALPTLPDVPLILGGGTSDVGAFALDDTPPLPLRQQLLQPATQSKALDELNRELFVAHACRATVAVLDAEDQLPSGGATATFVFSYVQAFPDALRRSGENPHDLSNPVVLLARKLERLVDREIERAAKEATDAELLVDVSLEAFQASPCPIACPPPPGESVWLLPAGARATVLAKEDGDACLVSQRDGTTARVALSDVRLRPPPRLVKPERLEAERGIARTEADNAAWSRSVTRGLVSSLLANLASMCTSRALLESGLQTCPVAQFRVVWSDEEVTIWRPVPPGDCLALGDVCRQGSQPPSTVAGVKVDDANMALAQPAEFKLLFKAKGASFWMPVPPLGYAAVGCVCTTGSEAPPSGVFACVRVDCLSAAPLGSGLWSGEEGSLWGVDNEAGTFLGREGDAPLDCGTSSPTVSADYLFAPDASPSPSQQLAWAEAAQKRMSCFRLSRTDTTSPLPDAAFWLLELLASRAKDGWRNRVVCPALLQVVIKLAGEDALRTRALRALCRCVSPSTPLPPSLRDQLAGLSLNEMHARQSAGREDPLFSSSLCALAELCVRLGIDQGEPWFTDLADLSRVLDCLDSGEELPDDVFMAEDMFLKLVCADDIEHVETPHHPYRPEEPVHGTFQVDGAESLVVRFDRRSATNFGQCLVLDSPSGDGVFETLQGNFGSCVVRVPGNAVGYRFPVQEEMNWCLSSTVKGPDIKLTNAGMTACAKKEKSWQTVVATRGFARGICSWEARVDKITQSSNIFFGVVGKGADVDSYVGCDDLGWGWIGCCACWHSGRKVKHPFAERLKAGDTVRLSLDLHRRTLSVAINGVDYGVALDRISAPWAMNGGLLYPALSFYNKNDQVTLLRGSQGADGV